eukprot:c10272_g1_i1.p1 GENE.c10272_g1_i1~~c10272_g1_i1.p1  ORF type:complete len:504 (-),score=105.61 c10272_g1_i1:1408-2853(-)
MSFLVLASDYLWAYVVVLALLLIDALLTLRSRVIQIRHFGVAVKMLLQSRIRHADNGVTAFQAFSTGLASRVGSGNIAGVAVAIYLGGPGAMFWMWVVALLGMATSFFETTLAQVFKEHTGEGHFRGGASFYIRGGLRSVAMAKAFSYLFLLSTGSVVVQSNSFSESLKYFHIPAYASGLFIATLTTLVIYGGTHFIIGVAEAVVPFMSIAYILMALVTITLNITSLPGVISLIFRCAFSSKALSGYAVSQAILNGVRRGLFSNEAGMGTAPHAAAIASPMPNHPVSQGHLGMIGVFVDTMLICSCTGFIILLSGKLEHGSGVSGMELTRTALTSKLGDWSSYFLSIVLFFFAFTTITATYYYAETNLAFLFPNHIPYSRLFFRPLFILVVFSGSVLPLEDAWALTDISIAFSTLINLVALVRLSGVVVWLADDFQRKLQAGDEFPDFDRSEYEFIDSRIARDVWCTASPPDTTAPSIVPL